MTHRAIPAVMASALLAISCSTSSATSDLAIAKSERVLGLDDDVRVEAQVYRNRPNGSVKVIYEIENRRREPIVIYAADSLPIYDPDTRTFTVNFGAEIPVPGSQPIQILSAERRTFEQTISLPSVPPLLQRMGNSLKIRLHFLMDALLSPELSEEEPNVITWAELKRTVDTNTIPVY